MPAAASRLDDVHIYWRSLSWSYQTVTPPVSTQLLRTISSTSSLLLTDHGVVEEQDALVALDETHAPHVRRQVVHLLAPHRGRYAVGQAAEIRVREYAAKLLRVI